MADEFFNFVALAIGFEDDILGGNGQILLGSRLHGFINVNHGLKVFPFIIFMD